MKNLVLLSAALALSANAEYLPLAVTKPAISSDDGAKVEIKTVGDGASDVYVTSEKPLSKVCLKWRCDFSGAKLLGDHWERAYGDLEWRDPSEPRVMPWYFLCKDGDRTDGYGVMVQPNAFASWQTDGKTLTLTLDLRAGGHPVELKGRRLKAVTLVSRKGNDGESAFAAGQFFCRMMCPDPRLPKEPVYGYNDWYCAYGDQTYDKFLRDLKPIVALAEGLKNRPFAVIDDGWQKNNPVEFNRIHGHRESGSGPWDDAGPSFAKATEDKPVMARLFADVEAMGAKPGLWYRPFKAWDEVPEDERLLADRDYFDPSLPQLRERVRSDTRRFAEWGAKLIKIDYLTFDLTGTWPTDLAKCDSLITDGRVWRDRSRTSVEVMKDLYEAMREGAGDDVVIIGCNAINHLAAGLFEVQRTGNDTSGRRWEQTRKYGVNAFGMRAIQNGTFFQADPDCVGLASAGAIDWRNNASWTEATARSGQAFFISWRESLMDDQVRMAFKRAFRAASEPRRNGEPVDWETNPFPSSWRFDDGTGWFEWKEQGTGNSEQGIGNREQGKACLVPMPRECVFGEGAFSLDGDKTLADIPVEYLDDCAIPHEGYRLEVDGKGVRVASSGDAGKFYALQTLRQLAVRGKGGLEIPFCRISDAPSFRWRGVHFDDARHFFGKETVKRTMELMAQHKLNVFHWHLSDNQGWRLPMPKYPRLATVATKREYSKCQRDLADLLSCGEYGPFCYTEEDIREVCEFARARHIRIVPEVDFPGHSRAALNAYPELRCPEPQVDNVFCLGNAASIQFMKDVLDEICRLFPDSDIIHIGGDEVVKRNWASCPKCSAKGAPGELQGMLAKELAAHLAAKGRRTIGWDEIVLDGEAPDGAIVMSWRGSEGAGKAAVIGRDAVMCPHTECYFDYDQGLRDDPATYPWFTCYLPLARVYAFDPLAGIPLELSGRVLGAECCNWTEFTCNETELQWKMWPRACALAEVLWTGSAKPGYADFACRMKVHRKRLLSTKVNCAPIE